MDRSANKAARGELRRGLPVGLVWCNEDGEVLLHPDEAIRGAIATIFERFTELGSVRQVWLWMRREGVQFPQQRFPGGEVRWVIPTYHRVHSVLENPSMPAHMSSGRRAGSATSTSTACRASGSVAWRAETGRS